MNKKVLEELAGKLNLDVEVLTKAISSEEDVDFTLPELEVFTKADLGVLLDNKGKERYDAGKIASKEMLLKDLSREAGLGTITDEGEFVKAYRAKILEDAQVEPNKKMTDLETSLETLRSQLGAKDTEISDLQNSYTQKETRYKAQSLIPDLPENFGLSKEEATSLYFMNHEIKDDGIYKNGQILKDKLENPLSLDDSITNWATEKGWNQAAEAATGRGGGSQGGQGTNRISNMEEYESHLKEKGINFGSAEANAILEKAAKDNPELLND